MNEISELNQDRAAYETGRRTGFGIAALALGLASFLSLLGAEKAILTIVLGVLASRGTAAGALPRRLGVAAIWLGAIFIVTLAVVLVLYHDKFIELIRLLQKLS